MIETGAIYMRKPTRLPTPEAAEGTPFVAIYYGRTISSARLIAVTSDPGMVSLVAHRLIEESGTKQTGDPVTSALESGRLRALRQILKQADADES